ncbi:hypothetical protein B0T14DRAFT_332384 [Immersiella caudata]|uniref:Uncharacterized protein n=1 Tax=Immersiella caudata TaxID=314043 RepID=A0AA39TNJ1_9PEZI|nr:hypothetical protein B0T14DRAFT_332384 [Immersiella caudata]
MQLDLLSRNQQLLLLSRFLFTSLQLFLNLISPADLGGQIFSSRLLLYLLRPRVPLPGQSIVARDGAGLALESVFVDEGAGGESDLGSCEVLRGSREGIGRDGGGSSGDGAVLLRGFATAAPGV